MIDFWNDSSASIPADVDLCKNLKPKATTSYFARGDGPYSVKLTPMPKENVIDVHLEAKEGNYFQGRRGAEGADFFHNFGQYYFFLCMVSGLNLLCHNGDLNTQDSISWSLASDRSGDCCFFSPNRGSKGPGEFLGHLEIFLFNSMKHFF